MKPLTPHWQQFQSNYADAHAALQWAAMTIFERAEDPAIVSEDDDVDLNPAIEAGFLTRENDDITFTNSDVRCDYLMRHAAELVLRAWDELEPFAEAFHEVQRRTSRLKARCEVASSILLILARDFGKDIVGRMGEFAKRSEEKEDQNWPLGNLYHPFCEALPELDFYPGALADALELVLSSSAGDGAGGFIYSAVEKLAARSQDTADSLYTVFVSRPTSPVVALTANALIGLARFDLPEAHHRALNLIEAEQPTLRRVGIAALGSFDYSDSEHHSLLPLTWECFEALRATPNPESDYTLTRAYGDLLDQKEEAIAALVELAARPDPAIRYQIALVLARKGDEANNESWYTQALLQLAKASSSEKGTLSFLDACASRYVKDDPETAVAFAEAIVTNRDYGNEGEDAELPELLSSTFSELRQHSLETLKAAITRWFASTEPRLHHAAHDVVKYRYFRSLKTGHTGFKLSKSVLDSLDEQAIVYALQRIMGYVTGGHALAELLLSALQRDSCSPAFVRFVTEALSEYVLYNYPGEAGDYLRSKVESDKTPEIEAKGAEAALNRSEAYFDAIQKLPDLKELRPPSQRVYLLRLAQGKQQAKIMEQVNERSAILSLAHQVPLKYGRGFFMELDGNFTKPSELSSFSQSVELPRGELIDPLEQSHRRIAWQSAGLSETRDLKKSSENSDT